MSILPQEHWDMLDNAIKQNTQRVKEFVQTRQAHKLAKLGAADNNEYVNKDRWVVNICRNNSPMIWFKFCTST